jgi:hydroxymethylbilane synthase
MLEAASPGLEAELVTVRTSGDERPGGRPSSAPPGDKSRFVKEIEDALLAGEADLAVHSAKDVPGELPDGLAIVGVPERADPRDALCGAAASLEELPAGARVGTSSLRRRAQLLAARPDLEVAELRGNVDTRLRKLADGRYDAVVLAMAGLARLERAGEGSPLAPAVLTSAPGQGSPLAPAVLTPAPGQGCLALEARADDESARSLGALVTDRGALVCLTAERALVTALEASCRTPVAAHARLDGDRLALSAFAGLPDGSEWIRDELEGDAASPAALGEAVAERLLAAGAGELLERAEAV